MAFGTIWVMFVHLHMNIPFCPNVFGSYLWERQKCVPNLQTRENLQPSDRWLRTLTWAPPSKVNVQWRIHPQNVRAVHAGIGVGRWFWWFPLTIDVNHKTSWWFSHIFMFTPKIGGWFFSHFDVLHIVQRGWLVKTHQPEVQHCILGFQSPRSLEMGVEPKNSGVCPQNG